MTDLDPWRRLDALPRCQLGVFPTPLVAAPRLSITVGGPRLWVKRDELIGFAFGGNKVRGLEMLLADADAKGADVLVTGAGAQSNHVRATATTAAVAGMGMVAVLWGDPPELESGNLRLTRLLGADVRFTRTNDRTSVDTGILEVSEELSAAGRRPYPIPRGGACALGALGHTLAAREMAVQCRGRGLSRARVVLAGGSGGTYAGWLLGNAWLGHPFEFEVVTVSRPAEELASRTLSISQEASAYLGVPCPVEPQHIRIHDGFIGAGYGIPTAAGSAAIALVAKTEGIFLDPTYTGKAFAWYAETAASLPRDLDVIFVHTGGEPALFAGDGTWVQGTRGDHERR